MEVKELIKIIVVFQIVSVTTGDVTSSDIQYTLYTRNDPLGVNTSTDHINTLNNSDFDGRFRRTFFIVYGLENPSARDEYYIKDYLLAQEDCNVFLVNWTELAWTNHMPRDHVILLGDFMTDFVTKVMEIYRMFLIKTVMIASSLGAHAAGRLSSNLNNMVSVINALDPTVMYPYAYEFLNQSTTHHLRVIHTNGGQKGIAESFGDADYFPNGGKTQPGCGNDEYGDCAHDRAVAYFAESLIHNEFIARNCTSYEDYSQGLCDDGAISRMGGMVDKDRTLGSFYLDTNDRPPYARG